MNRIEVNVQTGEQWTVELTAEEIAEIESRPPGPPPAPDYVAFWNALLTSAVYGSIRTQSMTSLPMNTLATEFIAFINDAKAGRPNETAIQSSIGAILTTGTFTEGDIEELGAILTAAHLGEIYALNQP